MPADLAVGVPLQLLENRPDVKAAELALASAYYTTESGAFRFLSQCQYYRYFGMD